MKKLMAGLVGLGAAAFLLVASGYAQMEERQPQQDPQAQQQQPQDQEQYTVTGQVADASQDRVQIINQEQNFAVPLQIPDDALVMMNGKQITADQIPSCAEVQAQYSLRGNELIAERITVMPQRGVGGAGEQTDEQKKQQEQDQMEPGTGGAGEQQDEERQDEERQDEDMMQQ